VVGVALGVSGAALQSVARNPLAAPDTLGVDSGAYLLLVLATALRWSLPIPFAGGLAFLGGVAAAGLVMTLASGAGSGPTRLVLAGSAIALALDSVTVTVLLLFREQTVGLFAWGDGSLSQYGMSSLTWMGPLVLLAAGGLVALAGRLDIHGLGDDAAAVLGVDPRRTRLVVVLLAVLLAAASVTVAGPVGFVGLAGPAIVRLLGPRVPGLLRHRALLPVSALSGVVVVLGADVLVRAVLGAQVGGVEVPTGTVTSLFGRSSWSCWPAASARPARCGRPPRRGRRDCAAVPGSSWWSP
jgi:iron complex transport system permease protein